MNEPTPEEIVELTLLVRILIGDTESSVFYPAISDGDILTLLKLEKYDPIRAAKRAALSLTFTFASIPYRERTDSIEQWQNVSLSYQKALQDFLNDRSPSTLPGGLRPYAGGISRADMCKYINDPDIVRSPLAQISPCVSWWTRIDNHPEQPCCPEGAITFGVVR